MQANIAEISDTVSRVKAVVQYFHRSIPGLKKLKDIQEQMNISPLNLKQDVTTRWNSTYDMLMRFSRVKEAIIATLAIMRPDLSLPQEDWCVIDKARELLKIFYDVTVEVSSENYVSAFKYIIFCKIINRMLSKYSSNNIENNEKLHNALQTQMRAKFREVENNTLLCEATILDP